MIRSYADLLEALHERFAEQGYLQLWGAAGVGKTTAANQFFGECPSEIPKFAIDARGVMSWAELEQTIARTVAPGNEPARDALSSLGAPLSLLLIDHIEDVDEIFSALAELAAEAQTCIVAISRFTGGRGAQDALLEFRGLSHQELATILDLKVAGWERLLDRLDGNPHATLVVAEQLKLITVTDALSRFHEILGGTGKVTTDELLDWSWRSISKVQQQALVGLAAFESEWTLADAAGVGIELAISDLNSLVNASLVRRTELGLSVPALVRAFVAQRRSQDFASYQCRVFAYVLDCCSRAATDPSERIASKPVCTRANAYFSLAKRLGQEQEYLEHCGVVLKRAAQIAVLRGVIDLLHRERPVADWSVAARLGASAALVVFRELPTAREIFSTIESVPAADRFRYHFVAASLAEDRDEKLAELQRANEYATTAFEAVQIVEADAIDLRLRGRAREGVDLLRAVISEHREAPQLLGELACCYAACDEPDEALALFEHVIPRMEGELWRPYFYTFQKANILRRAGQFERAIEDYDQVLTSVDQIKSTVPFLSIARQRISMAKTLCEIGLERYGDARTTLATISWLHPSLVATLSERRAHIQGVLNHLCDGVPLRFDPGDTVGTLLAAASRGDSYDESALSPGDRVLAHALALAPASDGRALVRISPDYRYVQLREQQPIDFSRKKKLRSILEALAIAKPTQEFVSSWALFDAVWPEFKGNVPQTGLNRLYLAMSRLRAAGLEAVIETNDEGYRFQIDVEIEVGPVLEPTAH